MISQIVLYNFLNNQIFILQILFILFTVIYILTNNNNTITAVLIHNHKILDQIIAALISRKIYNLIHQKKNVIMQRMPNHCYTRKENDASVYKALLIR